MQTPAQPVRREAAGSSWLWKQCAGVARLWPPGEDQGTEGAGREACSLVAAVLLQPRGGSERM